MSNAPLREPLPEGAKDFLRRHGLMVTRCPAPAQLLESVQDLLAYEKALDALTEANGQLTPAEEIQLMEEYFGGPAVSSEAPGGMGA